MLGFGINLSYRNTFTIQLNLYAHKQFCLVKEASAAKNQV